MIITKIWLKLWMGAEMTTFQNILTLETYQMKNLTRDVRNKMKLRPQDVPEFAVSWHEAQAAIIGGFTRGILTEYIMENAHCAMQFEYLKNGLSPNIRKAALAVAGIRDHANE